MKKFLFNNSLFLILALLLVLKASAQTDSCNIFLQGRYIEVGINTNGAYGSSVGAPAGYHPKGATGIIDSCYGTCPNGNLGFVADPDKNGWTIGTPAYFGDYFMPGYPQEGWSIMADGNQANAWNGGGQCSSVTGAYPFSVSGFRGSNISYITTTNKRTGIWQGSYDSLLITQTTTVDTSKVFFTVYVSLVNKAHSTRNNVYYLRTVDADNDEPEVGLTNFTTINSVDYQLPNSLGATLISSSSLTYPTRAYLGLGTLDCRAKCFYNKASLIPSYGTIDSMYGKYGGKGDTVRYIYSGKDTDDIAINLAYKLGNIAAGDSVNFAFAYILKQSDITAAFQSTQPSLKVDTVVHQSGDTIRVCRGSTIPLSIANAGGYTWSWVSLTRDSVYPATGPSVSVKISDTAAISIIRAVGSSACNNDTFFIKFLAPPKITIDPVSALCKGGTVRLHARNGTNFSWSPSTGLSCTLCDSTMASPTVSTTYKVVGTNSTGCLDSAMVTVTIDTPATVNVTAHPATICAGDSTNLLAKGSSTYLWSPSGTISCATCDSTFAKPTATTTYTLVATDARGCRDTGFITINVNTKPVITLDSTLTICSGRSVTLKAHGGTSYTWRPSAACASCDSSLVSPTVTTTYHVTGTNANGCKDSAAAIITVNPLPTITIDSSQSICAGSTVTLTAHGGTSYVWSPSSTTGSTLSITPTATTKYYITGIDANGCSDADTATITVNARPTVSAGPDKSICNGSSTTLNATGATSYSWSPSFGLSCVNCASPVASPSVSTTYVVTGTNANGCTNTDTVVVTVTSVGAVNAGPDKAICIGSSTLLSGTGAVSYSWSPTTGLSCSTCAVPTASPSSTTTYILSGTNINGCISTDTVVVKVNPLPSINAGTDKSICAGGSTTLSASGGSTYLWTPTTGLSCSTCINPVATPSVTTTYVVVGTDSNGCAKADTVVVNVNPLPVVNAGADKTICKNSSTTLTATGAVSYSWSPTTGLSCSNCASPTASPSVTTTYIVTGTNANSCSDTDTIIVFVNPLPVVSAGADKTFCAGGSATLVGTGASSYSWSPSGGLSCGTCSNPIASSTATTTYILTGTDTNGCVNRDTVLVTVNPLPTVSAGPDKAVCNGTAASLTATGATSYTWSPAVGLSCTTCANPTANPSSTTTYVVTGTDAHGCVNTDTITVSIRSLPTVNAGSDVSICKGTSTILSATGASTYVWSPATGLGCSTCASTTATPSASTSYVVTGTDAYGCSNKDTVKVTVNNVASVSAGPDQNVCIGNSVKLTASGSSSYVWTPAIGLSCTTCYNPTATPVVTTTYVVTGSDTNGCSNSDTVVITVKSLPKVSAGSDQSICSGHTTYINASGASTYVWSPASGLACSTCASSKVTITGTTTYVVTGTDNYGCADSDSVTITVNPSPIITAGPNAMICRGNAVTVKASGAKNYSWFPASGLACTTCDSTIANPGATTTYTVVGTAANGCTDTQQVKITVNQPPTVSAGNDTILCNGDKIQLKASGATTYNWSPSATLSCATCSNPWASPPVTITYSVTGADIYGCLDSDNITVTVLDKKQTAIGAGDSICKGKSAQLYASGGTSYLWSPAASLNSNNVPDPIATPDVTTTYKVIVSQSTCFTDSFYVTVLVYPPISVNAGPDQNVIAGSSVQLQATATGATTYTWSPVNDLSCADCLDPVATPATTTTYTITVTNAGGCKATDDVTLNVRCDKSQVFIPNTFTPNGDGVNDRFYASGKGVTIIKRFSIYNRWGQLIYNANNIPINDPNYGWDGTFKGEQVKPDVFVYIIDATCESGEPIQLKGDISLVR
ncbi:MAG: gliding motility-associated C-terminal domain-containing protein [Flavipsychrobacter sp.]